MAKKEDGGSDKSGYGIVVGSNTTGKERDCGDRQLREVMWERVISVVEEGKVVAASRAATAAEDDGMVGSDYSSKR
ncbi:hypothetical protein GW17_00045939 [Ensete ventricosum]|nr:hypothetical protein GW17_00045939 [Ensete ventricosum]